MTKATNLLNVTTEDGVQTWATNCTRANELNPDLIKARKAALDHVIQNETLSAVILTTNLGLFSLRGDASWTRQQLDEIKADRLVDVFKQITDIFETVCMRQHTVPFMVIFALNDIRMRAGRNWLEPEIYAFVATKIF